MALLRPGVGLRLTETATETATGPGTAPVSGTVGEAPSVGDVLLDMVPTNVFRAFADGNVVQIVILALMLGIATMALGDGPRARLATLFEDLAGLLRRLVHMILWIAPVGIGALVAVTVGRYGADLIGPMARFLAGLWGAQIVIVTGYMLLLGFFSDFRPARFLRATGSLWATTAATTSSLASLSVGLETAGRLDLPRRVYSFVLPLGAQLNKDGTSVMLAAVLLFTAQAAGRHLLSGGLRHDPAPGHAALARDGRGFREEGFVVALIYVQALNLPIEVAAIVGGIYRLVDMSNTTVNIMGDMVGAALVARSEARRA